MCEDTEGVGSPLHSHLWRTADVHGIWSRVGPRGMQTSSVARRLWSAVQTKQRRDAVHLNTSNFGGSLFVQGTLITPQDPPHSVCDCVSMGTCNQKNLCRIPSVPLKVRK